jgi:hypothetical protein
VGYFEMNNKQTPREFLQKIAKQTKAGTATLPLCVLRYLLFQTKMRA